jgi:hypothetical protein
MVGVDKGKTWLAARAAEKLSNARATSAPGRPNVYPAQAKMVHGKFARLQLDNHHEFAKVKH